MGRGQFSCTRDLADIDCGKRLSVVSIVVAVVVVVDDHDDDDNDDVDDDIVVVAAAAVVASVIYASFFLFQVLFASITSNDYGMCSAKSTCFCYLGGGYFTCNCTRM